MKFEKKISRIRKLDLDMIWDHDRYVKASPGSNLQSSNNGLTIFDNLRRKSGIFSASKQIRFKKRFWDFFENYRKSMSRSKISSWNYSESKEHIRNIFPRYLYERRISKNEKNFMNNYFISVFQANFHAKFLNKILKKKNSFFQNRHSNQHLTNIFRMCSFDSEWFQSDILDLDMDFRYFSKKFQNRFL